MHNDTGLLSACSLDEAYTPYPHRRVGCRRLERRTAAARLQLARKSCHMATKRTQPKMATWLPKPEIYLRKYYDIPHNIKILTAGLGFLSSA